MFLDVPGITVLLMMTTGCFGEVAKASPIDCAADLTWVRSISPDFALGVPTAMKMKSASEIASKLLVQLNIPLLTFFFRRGESFSSRKGTTPSRISFTFFWSRSTPVTWNLDARQAAVESPTYPRPTIATRNSSDRTRSRDFGGLMFRLVVFVSAWHQRSSVRASELQPSFRGCLGRVGVRFL